MLSTLQFLRTPLTNLNLRGDSLPRLAGRVRTESAWPERFAGVQGRSPCLPGLAWRPVPARQRAARTGKPGRQGVEELATRAPCTPQAGAGKEFMTTGSDWRGGPPVATWRSPLRPASRPVGMRLIVARQCFNSCTYSTQPHSQPGRSRCDALRSRIGLRPGCGSCRPAVDAQLCH
jgi:hypothetical protein